MALNPGPDKYKPNHNVSATHSRSPVANMKRDMVKRSPDRPKDKGPSPVSYPEKEKNWKTQLSTYEKVPNYTLQKEKAARFLDKAVKQKKWVPSVGAHDVKMENFMKLSRAPNYHFRKGI